MALVLVKTADGGGPGIIVTCESNPPDDGVALEWVTDLGFCFRMNHDVAMSLLKQLDAVVKPSKE